MIREYGDDHPLKASIYVFPSSPHPNSRDIQLSSSTIPSGVGLFHSRAPQKKTAQSINLFKRQRSARRSMAPEGKKTRVTYLCQAITGLEFQIEARRPSTRSGIITARLEFSAERAKSHSTNLRLRARPRTAPQMR